VGFALVIVTEIISAATGQPSLPLLNAFAGSAVLAAVATGGYAAASLARHNSRRVRWRTFVGMIIALCGGAAVTSNLFDRQRQLAPPKTAEPLVDACAADAGPLDTSLVKPGWYGEIQTSHILLSVTSFESNTTESRRFNRGLLKPVSYAALSVMNMSRDLTLSVDGSNTLLILDDGTELPCLALERLFAHRAVERFAAKRQVAPGMIAADIPICMEADFSWKRVAAVRVNLGNLPTVVPGRYMTAQEKAELLASRTGTPQRQPVQGGSPEAR